MFGKRASEELPRGTPAQAAAAPRAAPSHGSAQASVPAPAAGTGGGAAPAGRVNLTPMASAPAVVSVDQHSDDYYQIKTTIFSALIDTIDLAQLAQLDV